MDQDDEKLADVIPISRGERRKGILPSDLAPHHPAVMSKRPDASVTPLTQRASRGVQEYKDNHRED